MLCHPSSFLYIGPLSAVTTTSAVAVVVKDMEDAIRNDFHDAVTFMTGKKAIRAEMDGLWCSRGLQYCAGAVGGTHIRWHKCTDERYFEYR